jgi:hypothetical protein
MVQLRAAAPASRSASRKARTVAFMSGVSTGDSVFVMEMCTLPASKA